VVAVINLDVLRRAMLRRSLFEGMLKIVDKIVMGMGVRTIRNAKPLLNRRAIDIYSKAHSHRGGQSDIL